MKDSYAIVVEGMSKDFVLPHQRAGSVKGIFTNILSLGNTKSYETQHALRDISLKIKKGEFFGIVGKNGSGKSTLLKILAGIYQPSTGKVTTSGRIVPFIELGVGFNGELTGRENVFLNGALLGFSEKEVVAKYDEIVAFAELERFMDQKLKNYSSGMQVRLAFSVATRLAESDILIIDEVLAVGDANFQRKCFEYFKTLKKMKKTVVFVSHDMGAVKEYCDRAVLIQDGVVKFAGSADKASNEYLKLFNVGSQIGESGESSENRWGNGSVKFESVRVIDKADKLEFVVTTRAYDKPVSNVVLGLRVLDVEMKVIAGVSTANARGAKRISYKANEKKILTFETENILGSGTYYVGGRIRLEDGVTVCDDWEGAAKLNITKANSYYPVVFPAHLDVK